MPRKRKRDAKSDDTYNARRRFIRRAMSALNKSKDTVGATSDRYRLIAQEYTLKAANLYERNANIKRKGDFDVLSREFNVNVKEFTLDRDMSEKEKEKRRTLVEESKQLVAPEHATKEERTAYRRDQEARAILNSPVGSRIYAGTVDIWATPKFENGELKMRKSQEDINASIMDYYGVSSMMDVIELLQSQLGDALFADHESVEKYDLVSLSITKGLMNA